MTPYADNCKFTSILERVKRTGRSRSCFMENKKGLLQITEKTIGLSQFMKKEVIFRRNF